MKPRLAWALLALAAGLLFFRLGRPALWQDEAETALRAVSILHSGVPRMTVDGALVSTQPSLAAHEGTAGGIWIWNTWLPPYLTAGSFAVFGRSPWAARLPFALAALLCLWLSWTLFSAASAEDAGGAQPWAAEMGLACLALSPAFLLFSRQSRYYALSALGAVLVLHSWRRLLADKPGGVWALVGGLQFLLHSAFAFFVVACLAVAADAALRFDECRRFPRFRKAALATLILSLPSFWFFRLWERPGNHLYGAGESLEFLKTFLLWLALFACPIAAPALAALEKRRVALVLTGFFLLCGLVGEGTWPRAAALAVLAWCLAQGVAVQAPRGEMSLRRMSWLWLTASLAVLSLTAAEPYGRYLMGVLPVTAYLGGVWLARVARGRVAVALAVAACAVATNWLGWLPVKAASFIGAPRAPVQSVSGMMRQRLRDVSPRSDLLRLVGELARGPQGYIEPAAAAIVSAGGGSVFSAADNLSLMFASGAAPIYGTELSGRAPDWILVSAWLRLDPRAEVAVQSLLSGGLYELLPLRGPLLLWQNNPDPLYRDFSPRQGPLPLFRRKKSERP